MAAVLPAKDALEKAIAAIDNPSQDDAVRMKTWFGAQTASEITDVRQILVNEEAFFPGVTFQCPVNNASIEDAYAEVLPDNSFAMEVGPPFFAAPDTGFSSKPGILVHEMSHYLLVGATRDPPNEEYGTTYAKARAISDPGAARKNAENVEYFVEATAFGL
jgi:peptidyl-Lys metalloendopeptidase